MFIAWANCLTRITQALERVYNATVSTTSHAHENVQLKQCIELLQKKLDEITTSSVATTAQGEVKLQEATIRIETTEAQARELEEMLTIATENYNNEVG
jgi:16S rRNA U516 pseudouridylate synthase RsuA-like enzyme